MARMDKICLRYVHNGTILHGLSYSEERRSHGPYAE